MDNNFKKFKRKLTREHLLKAILFGITGGLSASSISLITSCATGAFLNPMAHIGIGLASLVATTLSYFFAKKPSDKKIAARMDAAFQGNEKYLTMVEYQDKEGLIIEKQREDAQQELEKKSPKALPLKLSVWNIPALILAGSFFTASCFTTQIKEAIHESTHRPDPDEWNDKTSELIDRIQESIDENDKIDSSLQDEFDDILKDLESDLKDDVDTDSRQDKIDNAKDKVDEAVDNANSKEEIGDALENSEDDALKKLGEAIKEGDNEKIQEALDELNNELQNLNGQELVDKLNQIADEIRDALKESQIPEGDELRDALNDLADQLEQIADELQQQIDEQQQQAGESGESSSDQQGGQQGGQSGESSSEGQQQGSTPADDQAKEDAEEAIDEAGEKIKDAVNQQNQNEQAGESTKDQMDQLKDPSQSQEGQEGQQGQQGQQGQEGEGEGQGQGQSSSSGEGSGSGAGAGSGGTSYGSNDNIFTENGDSHYGDVINEYLNEANDDAKGNDDQDLADAIDDYFKDLFGSAGEHQP